MNFSPAYIPSSLPASPIHPGAGCSRLIQRRSPSRGLLLALVLLAALLIPPTASARIQVVTLPGRDSVQLTIYNSVDLTMVKETRFLTLREGLNRLEFSWANTLIDPTSVEFRALTHADEVEVLDVSFPARVTNTLEWRINSEFAGEVQVEIRYFTSGIKWSADYVAEVDRTEQSMALAGAVQITNHSGEDYENAQVRLVVGIIRLVEEIAMLAQQGRPADPAGQPAPPPAARPERARLARGVMAGVELAEAKKEIVKEGVSEYFLYTVEGRDTIPTGWTKRLPSFDAKEVPITSLYKYERERWGDNVMRFYRFKNDEQSKLGTEPLPDGDVKAFRISTDDQLYSFVGRTRTKYIPINEEVELELGRDQEVLIKPKLMNWEKTDIRFDKDGNVRGWTIKEAWEIEVQNSREIDVVLDIRRNFSGDWTITSEAPHEKLDAAKVKFVVPLKPREKKAFTYEVTTRHGLNATR
jgi:hypothetical protein